MAANVFGAKQFKPTPPDKGSFPLDHEGKPTPAVFRIRLDTHSIWARIRIRNPDSGSRCLKIGLKVKMYYD
jgi:hypothetical protein